MGDGNKVILKVEKEEYAKKGVHKGTEGWIVEDKKDGRLFVWFRPNGDLSMESRLLVREEEIEPGQEKFREYDRVVLLVEKEEYARDGIHKGMDGWIFEMPYLGSVMVMFDQYGAMSDIGDARIKEEELELANETNTIEKNRVVLLVEKEEYASKGFHKGMTGLICDPEGRDGKWLVEFEGYEGVSGENPVYIDEDDLEVTYLTAWLNEASHR